MQNARSNVSTDRYILCIETGTDVCSVGLARVGEKAGADAGLALTTESADEPLKAEIIALRETAGDRDHARRIAVFTQEVLAQASLQAKDLSAVAVSKGPGSYTGLRIGVSFAKGLCYGLGIPLIGVGSLDSLCAVAMSESVRQSGVFHENHENHENGGDRGGLYVPMIDARRMEVYGRVFDAHGAALTPVEAWVIDENSLAEWRERNQGGKSGDRGDVIIFGDGAEKCRETLPWACYVDVHPSASGMVRLAAEAFTAGDFEDIAYFEPFYLKDFVITTSKKKLL
ncbi:MAG: tRNA (adenosine(37)-N6)-threonylcarbamoyltransferase complex dimerization subunit type 1 TsaB [Alistipes sp.]|jgi:tRNA threonylcarbamoyladenosine biosynthesis protein TsaB|nr:tRNA (adenosine(37)-N6)-threonylcarbamoyltransferase complex dimerization subunit type 1 TsaB [Alistipes sp.]